jgi:hypothetical protein
VARGGTKRPGPLGRASRDFGECGLCGRRGKLTKTHVPPQCAGNRGRVKRFMIVSDSEHRAAATTKRIGGVHFYELCVTCNGDLQGLYDPEYCTLAKALWAIATDAALHLPPRVQLPDIAVRPGAIARSVVIGAFALNPTMRLIHPDLAQALVSREESIDLPSPLRLHLALTRGPHARVTGSIGGYYMFRSKVGGRNVGIMSMAQIYFPPLAWQLADQPESVLLQQEGWSDVSSWLTVAPSEQAVLSALARDLPLVAHPTRGPGGIQDWVELLSDETCFIVESDNAVPASWTAEEGPTK